MKIIIEKPFWVVGFGLSCIILGFGALIYFNTIPNDHIFINIKTHEVLSGVQLAERLNPILFAFTGLSGFAFLSGMLGAHLQQKERNEN